MLSNEIYESNFEQLFFLVLESSNKNKEEFLMELSIGTFLLLLLPLHSKILSKKNKKEVKKGEKEQNEKRNKENQ